jgi:hypothetical protein
MNCYVVRESGASEAVVIDPVATRPSYGCSSRVPARVRCDLVTHADADHVVGLADLAEGTEAPVYAPPKELMPTERATGWLAVRPYDIDTEVTGGETLDVAGITFEATAIPGHSPDHVAYYADGSLSPAISSSRLRRPRRSLRRRLGHLARLGAHAARALPTGDDGVSGHGPPTTLGAEKERNPFLAELRG